jgi:hypothetical protein
LVDVARFGSQVDNAVMPALVARIHAATQPPRILNAMNPHLFRRYFARHAGVDGRDKRGHEPLICRNQPDFRALVDVVI